MIRMNAFKENEKGIVIVWFAVLLPVLLLFSALTLDMGRAMMVAGIFQDALDAAAWAAVVPETGEIFVEPSPTPIGQNPRYVVRLNTSLATIRARDVFKANWGHSPTIAVQLIAPDRVRVAATIRIQTYLVGPLFGEVVVVRVSEAQSVVW